MNYFVLGQSLVIIISYKYIILCSSINLFFFFLKERGLLSRSNNVSKEKHMCLRVPAREKE